MSPWLRGFLSVMLFALALLALYRALRRIREAGDEAETATSIRNFPVPAFGGKQTTVAAFDDWFARLCYFVGGGVQPTSAALGIGLLAIILAGVTFVFTRDPMLTVLVATAAVLAFVVTLVVARRRAIAKFQQQFPAALDLFSRAIRAGESVDQAMHLLATAQIGEPSRTEFSRCAGHLEMGLSLPATLGAMCDRVDLTDVRIFSSAMVAHRDGGGNLATTLERLAAVIRDRVNYRQQLKAVTGASRISVTLIAGLGPLLFAWLFLVHPEYGAGLWEDSMGRMLLTYAVISECIGLTIVAAMLRSEY